jgi:signal transduction histidine kinase
MGTPYQILRVANKLRYSIVISFLFLVLTFVTLSVPTWMVQSHYAAQVESIVHKNGPQISKDLINESDDLFKSLFILNGIISTAMSALYFYINYRKFQFINNTKKEVYIQKLELQSLIDTEKEKKLVKDKQEEISFRLNIAHSNSRNLKNVISGVNHEVAPWLGIIRNVSNMMNQYMTIKTDFNSKDFQFIKEKIKEIETSAEQCICIVDNLSKNIKYLQKYDMTTTNIGSTIKAMVSVALLNSSIRKNLRQSQIEVDYESLDFSCKHSPMFLHQIILNLVNNAIDHNSHMRESLRIKIYGDKKTKSLFVEDNGKGISEAIMQNIFTPNFTTKDDHVDSHGLGLAMCMDYAVSMGAYIDVRSIVGLQTVFFIEFEMKEDDESDGDCNSRRVVGSASNVYKAYKERKEKTKTFDTCNTTGFLAKVKVDEVETDIPWNVNQ